MSTAREVLAEEYDRSLVRQEYLEKIRKSLEGSDHEGALIYIHRVLQVLSHSEDRVMRLHAECVAMLEQAGKILELDASLRPVIVNIERAAEHQSVEQEKKT